MTKNGQKWQEMAKNGTCDGLIVTKPVLNDFSSSKTPKLIPNIDIYEITFFALFWHKSGTKWHFFTWKSLENLYGVYWDPNEDISVEKPLNSLSVSIISDLTVLLGLMFVKLHCYKLTGLRFGFEGCYHWIYILIVLQSLVGCIYWS